MSKSYSWEDIRNFLSQRLLKTKHIMTFGTIGSCNIDHDIDIIVTKKPSSESAAFFLELHTLLDAVDIYLQKKHGSKLIRTSRFSDQEEIKYIAKYKEKDLVFQVLSYVSLEQIKMHWYPDLSPGEDSDEILKKNYTCIIGRPQDLFQPSFRKWNNEQLFIRLNDSDRMNSHFPDGLLTRRMNILFDFILRKRLGQKPLHAKNKSEVRKNFYTVCKILDKK